MDNSTLRDLAPEQLTPTPKKNKGLALLSVVLIGFVLILIFDICLNWEDVKQGAISGYNSTRTYNIEKN